MKFIDPSAFSKHNRESLHLFLSYCQQRAQRRQAAQLASISLEASHLDPLAVLESIYEPDEWHCYIERPHAGEAIAGAEAVVRQTFTGPERFQAIRNYTDTLCENTVVGSDPTLPFVGPHFFCGLTFFDELEEGDTSFAPATVFVPRWQVARRGATYTATANAMIDVQTDLDAVVDKVWQAHQKFQHFAYTAKPPYAPCAENERELTEVCGDGWYEQAVAQGLQGIRAEAYDKIVLARALDLQAKKPLVPLESLNRLRERFPGCFAFSFANDKQQSFIGATPERLLRITEGTMQTEALAGSAPRGESAREDAELAAGLLSSDKDRREQYIVLKQIIHNLQALGMDPQADAKPRLLPLSNVQHLLTSITAVIPKDTHLLDILQVLHPTAAVGGIPKQSAMAAIRAIEPFARGLYAGTLGWFDGLGNGEMVVGIRSALMDSDRSRARLYAGAGIVEGSDPSKEKKETDIKLRALLDVL